MTSAKDDLRLAEQAMRLAVLTLPHLAGLARRVQLVPDRRLATAGVFRSGRLLFNPDFLRDRAPRDAAFIAAHELLHLALRTHRRGEGSNRLEVNYAHDYLINDMLAEVFGRPVPAGGLDWPGARMLSLERILTLMRTGEIPRPNSCWSTDQIRSRRSNRTDLDGGLKRGGRSGTSTPTGGDDDADEPPGDALTDELERRWFPDTNPHEQETMRDQVERAAARAVSLGVLRDQVERLRFAGTRPAIGAREVLTGALRGYYHTPWQAALQKWLEASVPGDRTFARPSRRGADRTDLVLPGRIRNGWTLHLVLDTSGSMEPKLRTMLGMVAAFCESVGVERVHVIQCDTDIRADEWVEVAELHTYRILGLGDDDKRPALLRLASDPEVQAALVLTDADVTWYAYPPGPLPYEVLWVLLEPVYDWEPPYGQVITLDESPVDW